MKAVLNTNLKLRLHGHERDSLFLSNIKIQGAFNSIQFRVLFETNFAVSFSKRRTRMSMNGNYWKEIADCVDYIESEVYKGTPY